MTDYNGTRYPPMKTQKLEALLGGPCAQNLCPDALMGLNRLAQKLSGGDAPGDELFDVAVRHADDEQLRKLARLRLEAARNRYLD